MDAERVRNIHACFENGLGSYRALIRQQGQPHCEVPRHGCADIQPDAYDVVNKRLSAHE